MISSICKFAALALSVFAIAGFTPPVAAQGTTGSIRGTVTDQTGAPIPAATVFLKSENSSPGFEKSVTADARGYFSLTEIPVGSYRIKIESRYFRSFGNTLSVYVDDTTIADVTLEVSFATTTTVVVEPFETVDPKPEVRTSAKSGFLERLPSGPTFGSLVKIATNARPEPLVSGFQIDGNSGGDNTYFVDGQEVTNFRTGLLNTNFDVPFELIDEVQVRSGGIGAEYSGAVGGVVNLITKGGGNSWRGNFGISFTPSKLQGSPSSALVRFGSGAGQIEYFKPNKDGGSGYFPTASLSGPILKDKLWFFASYSPQISGISRTIDYYNSTNPATRAVTESIRYKSNVRAEQSFVRLDAQPIGRLRLFGTYLYNPIVQDGALPSATEGLGGAPQQASGLRGADYLATRGGRQNSQMVNGQATIDVTKNFLVTARGGYGFLNEKLDSYGVPKTTRFICNAGTTPPAGANCSAGFQNIASNSVRDYEVSKRTTFDVEGQLNGIDLLGRHHFKFGYGYNRVFNKIREGYTDTGIVQLFYGRSIDTIIGLPATPGNLGSGFLQRFGTDGEAAGSQQSLFGQDSWTIAKRLTLSLGLRLENESLPRYGDPVYPASTIVIGGEFDLKWNWGDKIAPRVAGVFDVFGNGKSKASASFGLYYDRMKFDALQRRYSEIFYRDYFEILPARGVAYTNYTYQNIIGGNPDFPGGQCPIVNSLGWSICQISFSISSNIPVINFILPDIDGGLRPSRTREFTVGFEQRLMDDLIVSGRYLYRDLDRAIEDVGTFNGQGSEQYTTANPGFGPICEVSAEANLPCAKAQRRYDAFEVIVDKRSAKYFLNASYTYSRLFGNYSGLSNSDEGGRTDPNNGRYFDLPMAGFDADGDPDNGRLATDRPHVFKAYGGYTFRWGQIGRTSVSAFTTIQSGTPLTTVYSLYNVQNSILFGRGDLGRTETFSETDLRVSHRFNFGQDDRFSLEPFVVFLNLFDERNEIGRQTQISSTNFTSTTLTQGGCTNCTSEAAVFQVIHNGSGISRFVQNYLDARGPSSTGYRNDYNLAGSFQSPRSVQIGVRLVF
ncbi:MAG: TonB-dependent receptor [Acidobacteria bacterium]|nr:TonB-dependent receptor [Acidobacteriota bacterium]